MIANVNCEDVRSIAACSSRLTRGMLACRPWYCLSASIHFGVEVNHHGRWCTPPLSRFLGDVATPSESTKVTDTRSASTRPAGGRRDVGALSIAIQCVSVDSLDRSAMLSTLVRSGCLLHTLSRHCVCRHSTWTQVTQLRTLPPLGQPQSFHSETRCSASSDSSGASTSTATTVKPPLQFNVRRLTKSAGKGTVAPCNSAALCAPSCMLAERAHCRNALLLQQVSHHLWQQLILLLRFITRSATEAIACLAPTPVLLVQARKRAPHLLTKLSITPQRILACVLSKAAAMPSRHADDVECSFARSGGAGGQNVNKVNTKVDMRFDLDAAGWIPDEVKDAIKRAVS